MIAVPTFIRESWEDFNSPTTSTFASKMGSCRQTVASLEETLDLDRSSLTKIKKSVKALYNTGNTHVNNEAYFAENLERLGNIARTHDNEGEISTAFMKFSHVTKDLSSMMKNMMDGLNNMVLYPLDSFLKGDLKGAKGDLRKPFDKAWKDYETKFSKTEKEKKKQAQEAGMVRAEISGAEIAEEMEKERKIFQLQMCEYLIKINEIRTKKGPDLLQSMAEYYQAQANFFRDGIRTIEHFHDFVGELQKQVQKIRQRQDAEKRQLIELREALKNSMTSYKEPPVNQTPAGYSLHQLTGDKSHGCEKTGFLLKKSEGRMRRVWQKRRCIIRDGSMYISHHDLVPDDIGKKCFDLVSSLNNRTYHFQADETKEMDAWISVLNNAKEEILMQAFKDNSNSPMFNQSVRELTSSIMDRIRRLPGNKMCCDCDAPDPEWLSVNLGVIVCLECCGIHREMGVHISRTQSTVIDELGTSQLLLARVIGNSTFNDIMEGTLDYNSSFKPKPNSDMNERRDFIKDKYIHHKFAIKSYSDREEQLQELKQVTHMKDLLALYQLYAEGLDLSTSLPNMENGENALHLAILEDDGTSLPLVDFLIQNSVIGSLDRKTTSGDTALHLCAELNRTECMKLLLRTRPELARIPNASGQTPLDVAKLHNYQTCVELISGALTGNKDLFFHINIDWDLNSDERYYDMEYSDDELDGTPDKPKSRSRPSSLIVIPDALNLKPENSNSSTKVKVPMPSNVTNNGRTSPLTQITDGPSSKAAPKGTMLPPLPPRGKKPPPPPPIVLPGHNRNKSDSEMSHFSHKRTVSEPPPRPQAPDFKSLKMNQGSVKSSISNSFDKGDVSQLHPARRLSQTQAESPKPPEIYPPGGVPVSKMKARRRYRALYNCDADNDDELTFKEGEIIVVIYEEEEEWWEGEIEGQPHRRGLFPLSFVTPVLD